MASLGGCSKYNLYILPGILFYMGLWGFVTCSSSSSALLCALGITCKGGVGDTAHLAITVPLSVSLQCRRSVAIPFSAAIPYQHEWTVVTVMMW